MGTICGVKVYLLFGYTNNSILINFFNFLPPYTHSSFYFVILKFVLRKSVGSDMWEDSFQFNTLVKSWLASRKKFKKCICIVYRSVCCKIMLNAKMRKLLSFGCACVLRCSAVYNSLQSHDLYPSRLLCSWNCLWKNTGVSCHFLLKGIFLTQGLNPHLLHLLHWWVDTLSVCHLGSLSFGYNCIQ